MAELDRSTFIALLNRLGAADDAEALAAARELHATLAENGVTWDSLLVPDSGPEAVEEDDDDEDDEEPGDADVTPAALDDHDPADDEVADDDEDDDEDDEDEDSDEEGDESEDDEDDDEETEDADAGDDDEVEDEDEPVGDVAAAASASKGGADAAEDRRLIEKLLARKGLSQDTREDLTEFQRDLDKGKFSTMDRRYVRALAKRMGL